MATNLTPQGFSSVRPPPSEQRKVITLTAMARDDRSSGTATTTITVKMPASVEAVRLPDILFPRNSARVNNCDKRILLEQLKALTDRDPTGKIVFVGHTAVRRTRKAWRRSAR